MAYLKRLFIYIANSAFCSQLLLATLIFSIFFSVRYVSDDSYAYFLGEKKDFLILFAYISDILIILLCSLILVLSRFTRNIESELGMFRFYYWLPLLLLIFGFTSLFTNYSNVSIPTISVYFIILLAKAIVLHETIVISKIDFRKIFTESLIYLTLFESILAIYQFWNQSSLGLSLFGESPIGPYVWGVAKVEALGQVFVRSYGTFPHPNIFAAFLLFGLLIILYKLFVSKVKAYFYLYLSFALLCVFALVLTFSRAAWFAGSVSLTTVLIGQFVKTRFKVSAVYIFACSLLTFFLIVGYAYLPLIQQRGNLFDKAYQERKSYNQAAIEYIVEFPLFGIGPSESLLHMEQSLGLRVVEPWEVQPIHNYYLLLASEIGVSGLIVFLLYISITIYKSIKLIIMNKEITLLFYLLVGLCGAVILMLFDHYYYTFQSTVLLIWIWLGLLVWSVAHETKKNEL